MLSVLYWQLVLSRCWFNFNTNRRYERRYISFCIQIPVRNPNNTESTQPLAGVSVSYCPPSSGPSLRPTTSLGLHWASSWLRCLDDTTNSLHHTGCELPTKSINRCNLQVRYNLLCFTPEQRKCYSNPHLIRSRKYIYQNRACKNAMMTPLGL